MSDLPPVKYLDMAAKAAGYANWDAMRNVAQLMRFSTIAHARTLQEADRLREALAKYEPIVSDFDAAAFDRILDKLHGGCPVLYDDDNYDAALAQYKAERPSLSDDEALLIAREICARVMLSKLPIGYNAGIHDNCSELQFALSMVKRDPAALEAFRGVGRG